eukprot:Skav207256  [mRNA]  locus=scaffold2560:104811:121170:- [translate_table: standard]
MMYFSSASLDGEAIAALEDEETKKKVEGIITKAKEAEPDDQVKRQSLMMQELLPLAKNVVGDSWKDWGVTEENAMMVMMQAGSRQTGSDDGHDGPSSTAQSGQGAEVEGISFGSAKMAIAAASSGGRRRSWRATDAVAHQLSVRSELSMQSARGSTLKDLHTVVTDSGVLEFPEESMEDLALEAAVYLEYLKWEIDTESAFLELPLTILVLVSFAVLAMNILHQEQLYTIETAIEKDIIENANFAWSGNFGHKGIEEEYLHYARIVSGVRLRQAVSPAGSSFCVFPNMLDVKDASTWLAKPCFPSDLGLLSPEVHEAENFENLQREEFLFPDISSLQELQQQILDMEDGCAYAASVVDPRQCRCEWCKAQASPRPWLDEETGRVEISMVVYNPQYGSYTYVSVNFMFNRGGHVHSFIHCLSAFVNPLLRSASELVVTSVAAFLWIGALVYAAIGETLEIISVIRNSNAGVWKAVREDYIGFYNMVDWSSIIIGTLAIGYYIQSRVAAGAVNAMMPSMIEASLNPGSDYKATAQQFFLAAENMSKAREYAGKEKAMLSSDKVISVEYLVNNVTGMPYNQALRTLVNSLERDDAITEDVEFISDKLDFFDRLLAPGDAEYDFYFGADGHTPDEASRWEPSWEADPGVL